jgi:glycosyltransferase involved in cell wall biosynthesis
MLERASTVALMSYCCDTGVGLAGFDFYSHLPFGRWIVVPHRKLGITARRLDSRCHVLPQELEPGSLKDSLDGISTIFCIERGYYPGLFRLARKMGLRTILMPNAEWLDLSDPDIAAVDTFIAPTLACFDLLKKEGLESRSDYIPHPIDTSRFRFHEREYAETFLHCHGWGGYKGRKGTDIVLKAARCCPEMSFVVRCQQAVENLPSNTIVYGPTPEPEQQYALGDISIQPSRWEGVGLQILESMSCGLPTLVPDAPPMNEYQKDSRLCIPAHGSTVMIGTRPWLQWEMDHECLLAALRNLHNEPISDLSLQARKTMEMRSWLMMRDAYMCALGMA